MRQDFRRRWLAGLGALAAVTAGLALIRGAPSAATETTARGPNDNPAPPAMTPAEHAQVRPLFGDLHMHTAFSFDAFTFKTTATPDDAYEFAQGRPLAHPAGGVYRLDRPLDFLAVTDHSEFMGVIRSMADPANRLSSLPIAKEVLSKDPATAGTAFRKLADILRSGDATAAFGPGPEVPQAMSDAWKREVDAANRHYRPGRFTTLIGYEWTSAPDGRNLHRNVLFRTGTAPMPFSATDSRDPEALWKFLEATRAKGYPVLAIPHNSNGSDGTMFGTKTFAGAPITRDYATRRNRNEPIVEITQVKGTSDTHPTLSPNDEFSDFEILPTYIGSNKRVTKFAGGYVRDALRTGVAMQDGEGFNPYRFGLIGSTDSHVGMSPIKESNYFGKVGVLDGTPKARLDCTYCAGSDYRNFSASGLAVVWAPTNTREAVFDALVRKETYATTGTRMRVRFFAGWNYARLVPGRNGWVAAAYAGGVPMGGTLGPRTAGRPVFLVSAMKDPDGANLDRIQIVKVWARGGRSEEKVFDVALSGGRTVDPRTGKAPPVGDTIDRTTLSYTNTIGAASLSVRWIDPEFDPAAQAAYYVRVLEIPTPRWSSYDAKRLGRTPLKDHPFAIQERAYTSPIWYDARRAATG